MPLCIGTPKYVNGWVLMLNAIKLAIWDSLALDINPLKIGRFFRINMLTRSFSIYDEKMSESLNIWWSPFTKQHDIINYSVWDGRVLLLDPWIKLNLPSLAILVMPLPITSSARKKRGPCLTPQLQENYP